MTEVHDGITDEDLTAYLDGEADAVLVARIDAGLARDPTLVARLEGLTIPLEAVRAAFAMERLAPPPVPELPRPAANRNWQPLRLVASVVLALGLGFGGGYLMQPEQAAPGWIDVVASYQSLYMTETLEETTQSSEVALGVLEDFRDRAGVELAAATAIEGLDFRRAQVLGFKGKPLMQMAYLSEDGTPFALCVLTTTNADSAPSDRIAQGMAATSWVENGVGYLVIGGQDPARTRALAEAMKQRLGQG